MKKFYVVMLGDELIGVAHDREAAEELAYEDYVDYDPLAYTIVVCTQVEKIPLVVTAEC